MALLSEIPPGRLVVLCAGNDLRSDDGAGPLVAETLRERFPGRVFDGGQAPESFLGPVRRARPQVIALVDAADFGGVPGEVRVFSAAAAGSSPGVAPILGTHAPPLPVLMELIAGDTGALVCLVAIQARSTAMGDAMTPEVAAAAQTLASELAHLLKESEP
jgi:hydrogenase 3 maturation protease